MFTSNEQVLEFFKIRDSLGVKPGLNRMDYLLSSLNHPERTIQSIHVAGTNGKGSTIQFIQSALISSGYRVGVFTSPSMDGLAGHILHQNKSISQQTFQRILNKIYPTIQALDESDNHPTTFEILTTMALVYFSESVDIAIIETGMGGKYDTTNCLKPILSIITNISIDHTSFLGSSLQEIAEHKAGIIKPHTPVITGHMAPEARSVITSKAMNEHAPLYTLTNNFHYEVRNSEGQYQVFNWTDSEHSVEVGIALYGKHQIDNCSLAIKSLVLLDNNNFKIDWERTLQAFNHMSIKGRFEQINQNPQIYIDGAHNVAGIEAFLKTVKSFGETTQQQVIFAAFVDKDLQEMILKLQKFFPKVMFTTFDHPRAAVKEDFLSVTDNQEITFKEDWQQIISDLLNNKDNRSNRYYITGSLNFITQVREYVQHLTEFE